MKKPKVEDYTEKQLNRRFRFVGPWKPGIHGEYAIVENSLEFSLADAIKSEWWPVTKINRLSKCRAGSLVWMDNDCFVMNLEPHWDKEIAEADIEEQKLTDRSNALFKEIDLVAGKLIREKQQVDKELENLRAQIAENKLRRQKIAIDPRKMRFREKIRNKRSK